MLSNQTKFITHPRVAQGGANSTAGSPDTMTPSALYWRSQMSYRGGILALMSECTTANFLLGKLYDCGLLFISGWCGECEIKLMGTVWLVNDKLWCLGLPTCPPSGHSVRSCSRCWHCKDYSSPATIYWHKYTVLMSLMRCSQPLRLLPIYWRRWIANRNPQKL